MSCGKCTLRGKKKMMPSDSEFAKRILIFERDAVKDSHSTAISILMEIGLERSEHMNVKTILSNFCDNIGWGGDSGACYFIPYENAYMDDTIITNPCVYFEDDDDEDEWCVLSYSELYYYMKIMAKRYCKYHPDDWKFFDDLLEKFRTNHQIEEEPHA